MARPSNLTEKQRQEILRLSLAGDSPYAISQMTGIPESTVRRNVSAVSSTIKAATNQIVSGEEKILALPISAQIVATEYAASLRAMRAELGKSAMIGATNATRLHRLATRAIDHAVKNPDKIDAESLKLAAGITRAGNDAASIALDMIRINKDSATDDVIDVPSIDPSKLSDAAMCELLAAADAVKPR